jgi:prepilin-type processing-associated H-X9-DG protein
MRCPEVKGALTLWRNRPCHGNAVSPWQNISFGFNARLYLQDSVDARGRFQYTVMTGRIRDQGNVPLLWDVDGDLAASQDQLPIFSAPSLDSPLVFANDRFWYPAFRHNRKGNFAFVDGHVADSKDPLSEPNWQWGYQPSAR